ncbi:MAG: hypothetical protein ACTSU6_03990 [Candidatus Njordarchaeales archaeon]
MAWILLEGLDRSGKSTVAEYYKEQEYEVVHMDAPHKKFSQTGYAGPSYLEEMVEMYNLYAGKDVVFDRTGYGELIWPEVFNRMPLLNDEDYEYLSQLEYNQDAVRYLMVPDDAEAHWKRCVANKEPINRIQFVQAGRLYDKLKNERGFERKQLSDFSEMARKKKQTAKNEKTSKDLSKKKKSLNRDAGNTSSSRSNSSSHLLDKSDENCSVLTMEQKLNKANAIRTVLGGKIIRKKDSAYENLEQDIRGFLNQKLEELFSEGITDNFTGDEITVLKSMAQRIMEKME